MVGTEVNPIQIDEARIAGRRKYNRGRMLNGDNPLLFEDSDADLQNNILQRRKS
jgi:translation initiation factor IF-1